MRIKSPFDSEITALDVDAPGRTILLVDDSSVNLGVLVEGLESIGFDVLVARDGEEALERISFAMPDLILLDIMMPGIDGFEVCKRLKSQELTSDIPVIFMTSLSSTEDKVKGFELGAVDYVTKPLQIDEVRVRVTNHLKLRALQQDLEAKNAILEREIDERKRAEAKLKEALEFNESVINAIPDVLIEVNREGRYLNVWTQKPDNLAAQKEMLLGKTVHEVLSSEGAAIAMRGIQEADETGFSSGNILPIDLPQGTTYFEQSIAKKPGNTGSEATYIVLSRDITERIQMEMELKEREQEFRSLAEGSPDFIVRYDLEGRIKYMNSSLLRALGSPDYASGIGKRPSELWPDGTFDKIEQAARKAIETESIVTIEFIHPTTDGQENNQHIQIAPERDSSGKIIGTIVFGRDISEIKRLEKTISKSRDFIYRIIDSIPDPIFVKDREHRWAMMNDACCEVLGHSREFLLGKCDHEVLPNEQADMNQEKDELVFTSGEINVHERAIQGKDGSIRHIQTLKTPFPGLDEEPMLVGVVRDITSIREAELRLRHFIDNLPGIAYTLQLGLDGQLCFPYVSPAIKEIYGIDPDDVKIDAGPIQDLTHPDDLPAIETAIRKSAQTLSPFRIELRVCRPGYRERWFDLRATPERKSDGSTLWYGIMLDISERKNMEMALFESEKQFSAAFNQSPAALAFTSLTNMKLLEVNDRFVELFGYSRKELIGRTSLELGLWENVEERDQFLYMTQEYGVVSDLKFTYRKNDGSLRRGSLSATLIDTGNDFYVLTQILDITDSEQAEEKLRKSRTNMIEAQRIAHLGSWELDLLNDHLSWSDEIYNIFEVDPEQFGASYEAFLEAIHPEDRIMVEEAFMRSVESHTPYQIEHRLLFPEGRIKYVFERGEIDYDLNGTPLRSRGTVQDITERRIVEKRLAEKERAEARVQGQREFLTNMSHEIRTPLHGILGFSSMLADIVEDRVELSYIQSIQSSGKRLQSLMDDFIISSKMESGNFQLDIKPVPIQETVNEIHSLFSSRAASLNLDFSIHIDSSMPGLMYMDEPGIRQILTKLIDNGLKHTEEGYVHTSLIFHPDTDQEHCGALSIIVEDSGPGIPEEQRERVFDPFVQLAWEDTEPSNGTGLGLSIVKQLVEIMGGMIKVGEGKKGGARFKIFIPAIQFELGSDIRNYSSTVSQASLPVFLPATILIAMSDREVINKTKKALVDFPFYIIETVQLHEIPGLMHNFHPEVIIQDLKMDGIASLIAGGYPIHTDGYETKIIGVGNNSREFKEEEYRLIVDQIVDFPINKNDLISVLYKYLPSIDLHGANRNISPEYPFIRNEIDLMKKEFLNSRINYSDEVDFGKIRSYCLRLEKKGLESGYRIPVSWARQMQSAIHLYSITKVKKLWRIFDKLINH